MKYKVGDKVKYVSGNHGDSFVNPLWDRWYGKIIMTILDGPDDTDWYESLPYETSFEVGGEEVRNSYSADDLELVNAFKFNNKMYELEVVR
mgnify:CR=1 FL=1